MNASCYMKSKDQASFSIWPTFNIKLSHVSPQQYSQICFLTSKYGLSIKKMEEDIIL